MPVSISGRHFLKLLDYTPEEIRHLIKLSHNFKDLKRTGTPHRYLKDKNIVLLFENPLPAPAALSKLAGWTSVWA